MNTHLKIGRLLRADNSGFVVGCRINQINNPSFGALVKAPLDDNYQIYGLIYDIRIDDDGLVRQLVTAEGLDESIIADNRVNRNVPLEISVLAVGYQQGGQISHLLPPRPALSLDEILLCSADELCRFTSLGRFSYFRHVLRLTERPVEDLLASHLLQAHKAHIEQGRTTWLEEAMQELIVLLRDDYTMLMNVLSALADVQRQMETI